MNLHDDVDHFTDNSPLLCRIFRGYVPGAVLFTRSHSRLLSLCDWNTDKALPSRYSATLKGTGGRPLPFPNPITVTYS